MLDRTEAYGLTFAFPAGDQAVGRCLRDYGEFASPGVFLAGQMSAGGSFLDIGANIGSFALPVAARARRVVAIEAHPGLAEILRENVKANTLGNVEVIASAAGAAKGFVSFPVIPLDGELNYGNIGVGMGMDHLVSVPVVTIDAVAPKDTKFIKIDVEGYEVEVMKGAAATLKRTRPAWLVETATNTPENQGILATFQRSGYRTYWFWTPFVTPQAPKAKWSGKFLGDLNVLAVSRDKPGSAWPSSISGFAYLRSFGWGDAILA